LTVCDLCNLAADSDKLIAKGSFKLLDLLHHFSSGMKALATTIAYQGVDELRQSCGGAGFLLASGIADWWLE
jgi:alkylation response protein AidB-like acyl-CoA dehydrogenase